MMKCERSNYTAKAVPMIPPKKGHVPKQPNIVLRSLSETQAPRPLLAAGQHKDLIRNSYKFKTIEKISQFKYLFYLECTIQKQQKGEHIKTAPISKGQL